MSNRHKYCVDRAFWLLVFLFLSGCQGATVVMDSRFPEPRVKTIPLNVGVYYSEHFKTFRHEQTEKDVGTFVVETGKAQVSLFNTLLKGAFAGVKKLKVFPCTTHPCAPKHRKLNAILVPDIVKFELSIPEYTQDKIYEVWVNYNIRLYNPDGVFIMEWPLVAYGKTPLKFFKLKKTALTQATHVALRDAGVQFILSLEQPRLRQWLNTQLLATRPPDQLQVSQ